MTDSHEKWLVSHSQGVGVSEWPVVVMGSS